MLLTGLSLAALLMLSSSLVAALLVVMTALLSGAALLMAMTALLLRAASMALLALLLLATWLALLAATLPLELGSRVTLLVLCGVSPAGRPIPLLALVAPALSTALLVASLVALAVRAPGLIARV